MSQKLFTKHVLYYCLSVLIIYKPFTALATQIGKSDISYAKDNVDTPCSEMSQGLKNYDGSIIPKLKLPTKVIMKHPMGSSNSGSTESQDSNVGARVIKLKMPTKVIAKVFESDSSDTDDDANLNDCKVGARVIKLKMPTKVIMKHPMESSNSGSTESQDSNVGIGLIKLKMPTKVIAKISIGSDSSDTENTTMERNEHFFYGKDVKGMVNSWQENVLIEENPLPTHNDLNDISTKVENFDIKQDLSLTPNFKTESSTQGQTSLMQSDATSLSSDASSSIQNRTDHAEISDQVSISDKLDIDSKIDVSSPLKSISVNDIPSTPKREYKESDTLPIFDYTPSKIIIAYNQEQLQDQNSSKSVNDLHDMDMPVLFALSPVKSNEEVMSNSSMDITRIKFDSVDTQNNKGCVKSESDMDSPKVTLTDSSSDGESNELSEFSVMISECDDSGRESIFDDTSFEGNVKSDKGKSELLILDTDRLVSDVGGSDVIQIEKKVKVIGGIIGKNYKLLNHLNLQEMYLDSGIHEGNGFSLNADKIETIKNSRIILDKLDCNASKMTVNEGSWVTFSDVRNNVRHLNLGEDSRVSFINHDKDIKIPRIMPKEKGFGDVAINGGTVNGIGKRDFPVKSVIFLGGENIIADSVYANNVKFEIVARAVSSNTDTVIYSVNPFDGTLPQNWYLADANTLKPESGIAVFKASTVSEDRTDTQTASCSKSATASVNRTDETHISSHMEVTADVTEKKTATLPTSADILYAKDIDVENSEKETSNSCCKQEEARFLANNAYNDEEISNMSMAQKQEAYDMAILLDGAQEGILDNFLNASGAILINNVNDIVTGIIGAKIGQGELVKMSTKNILQEDAIGVSSGDEDSRPAYGLWLKGAYGKAKQGKTSKQAAYDSNTYGAAIGADMEFDDLLVVGAAYSPMKTDFKYAKRKKGDRLSSNSHIFSLYMQNYLNDKMSIKTILSGGISDIKSKRNIDVRVVAIGKMTNKFYYAKSSVDYKFACGDVNLIPQVGLKYTSFHDSSMKEKGAGLFNAIMKGKTYNELSAIGGMKVALHPRKLGEGIILNSSLHGYVEQILKNSKYTKQIKFAWSDEYFKNEIYDQNKQSYNLGGNVGVVYKNFELSTGYNLYLRKKYKGHQVSLILDVML